MGYPRMPQIDADGDGKLVFAGDWPKAGKRVRIRPILEESERVAKGRFANEGGEYAPGCHPSGMGVVITKWTGGVVALLLNHRLLAMNPPGSGFACAGGGTHPGSFASGSSFFRVWCRFSDGRCHIFTPGECEPGLSGSDTPG